MPQQVVNGAMLMCTFGAAPATLIVLPNTGTNGQYAGSQHHGFRADGEHPDLLACPHEPRQSHGCLGDGCGDGRADADAVRAGHGRAPWPREHRR